jgi:predicted metal-binding transcription factor (methanogenesis marker protein 9)
MGRKDGAARYAGLAMAVRMCVKPGPIHHAASTLKMESEVYADMLENFRSQKPEITNSRFVNNLESLQPEL